MATDHPEDRRTHVSYSLEKQEEVLTDLDPHLQSLLLEHAEGEDAGAGSGIVSREGGQIRVDVIAKLRDPQQEVPGLDVVRRVGDKVTATVALRDVVDVRTHSNVVSLKAARPVHRFLNVSLPEVSCDGPALRAAFPGLDPQLDGTGTIVGVVDSGCDFRHGNFLTKERRTRLLYLWDQRDFNRRNHRPVAATAPAPVDRTGRSYGYGREFNAEKLNAALGTDDAFGAIDYEIRVGEHGTHVMDIAAGNGAETGRPGVAPGADLIFVHLDPGDISGESSLGSSRRLLDAVEYIFEKAASLGKPAVVNLSLGTHGGPHDGTTWAEEWFDELLNEKEGRAMVIAAGNSFTKRSHTHGTIEPGQTRTLSWEVLLGDLTPNELEVWYGGGPLEITLTQPEGTAKLGPVRLGETHLIRRDSDGRTMGQITHRRKDPSNGLHQIDVILGRFLPKGTWKVEISNRGSKKVEFHSWIERDDDGQSRFALGDQTTSHTLGSIACGKATITVGAYNARNGELATFSSAGPTRDGRPKPDVSAPGQNVEAARSLGGSMPDSGTSMAAPHVAGLVALLFQANRSLTAVEVCDRLKKSARSSAAATDHDSRFGFGRISGVAALTAAMPAAIPAAQPQHLAAAMPAAKHGVPPPKGNNGDGSGEELGDLLVQLLSRKGTVRFSIQVEPDDRA